MNDGSPVGARGRGYPHGSARKDGALKNGIPTVLLLLLAAASLEAQRRPAIVGKAAPSLGVKSWINLPKGKKSLDAADVRGKAVYLYCFWSWCPACLSHGYPRGREGSRTESAEPKA